jgi:hypothetical protein
MAYFTPEELPENKYYIFETEKGKLNVMKRLNEDGRFSEAKLHFLFKTNGEVRENVFEGWMLFDGEIVQLF